RLPVRDSEREARDHGRLRVGRTGALADRVCFGAPLARAPAVARLPRAAAGGDSPRPARAWRPAGAEFTRARTVRVSTFIRAIARTTVQPAPGRGSPRGDRARRHPQPLTDMGSGSRPALRRPRGRRDLTITQMGARFTGTWGRSPAGPSPAPSE